MNSADIAAHDVDETLSEFVVAHVKGWATVAAFARDDLLGKRRSLMQAWAPFRALGGFMTNRCLSIFGTALLTTVAPRIPW